MALAGKLEDMRPADILIFLAESEKTGKLKFTTGTQEGMIVFRSGKIIYAASSSVRETFGSIALALDIVSRQELDKALLLQHRSHDEKRLGEILVEIGTMKPSDVEKILIHPFSQVVREIFEVAEKIFARGVIFAVHDHSARRLPQFGLEERIAPPSQRIHDLWMSMDEYSIITTVVRDREIFFVRVNQKLVRALGGEWPTEAVAIPIAIGDRVGLVFYGDNQPTVCRSHRPSDSKQPSRPSEIASPRRRSRIFASPRSRVGSGGTRMLTEVSC